MNIELQNAISVTHVTFQLYIHCCINWSWSLFDQALGDGTSLTPMVPIIFLFKWFYSEMIFILSTLYCHIPYSSLLDKIRYSYPQFKYVSVSHISHQCPAVFSPISPTRHSATLENAVVRVHTRDNTAWHTVYHTGVLVQVTEVSVDTTEPFSPPDTIPP